MKWLLAGVIGCMGVLSPAFAQEDDAAAKIEAVIKSQFSAFASDDAGLAFSYASPLIQSIFVNPETFRRMVRGSYPMIWAPKDIRLLGLRNDGGRRLQRVFVKDQNGAAHLFDYEMVMVDGIWRINGVFPVEQQQFGV